MKNFVFIKMAFRFLGIGSGKTVSNARKSLFGAVLGIGISIIPLIVVLVVSDGMIQGITSRTIELGTGHLQAIDMRPIASYKNAETEKNVRSLILDFNKDDFVENAWIERQGNGLVIGKNGRSGGTIRAVEPEFFTQNSRACNLIKVISGSLEFENNKSAVLGSKIAEKLGLKVGDTCRIITLNKNEKGKTIPRVSLFKISGLISSGYQELDALWVFIPLEEGLKIMPMASSLTSILISTKDPFDEDKMQALQFKLSSILPENFSIYAWSDLNRSSFVSFKTTKNILMFIMFLIVLVASANISSAIVMLVMERRREIAILKAAGAHPSSISLAFLLAGLLTSLGGIILGMPLGILTALHINEIFAYVEKILNYLQNFFYSFFNGTGKPLEIHLLDPAYYLEYIPVKLNLFDLYIIAVSMLILSVVVCLVPAVRAGKEKPIEIMRKL
ncbi:ABC transporter permease [Treponema putidum]|uniref:ABC transporter permease n=1 Tax=Treponema putidum TaxID=221027 RepID=A0ABY5HUV7_9SPIR|nr:ABC transporter permease [Treponema putidum]UTY28840.1 ABC transporter permease [Treponema putidum]UTY31263.1 ABC transporter permease [Treponema putidum]